MINQQNWWTNEIQPKSNKIDESIATTTKVWHLPTQKRNTIDCLTHSQQAFNFLNPDSSSLSILFILWILAENCMKVITAFLDFWMTFVKIPSKYSHKMVLHISGKWVKFIVIMIESSCYNILFLCIIQTIVSCINWFLWVLLVVWLHELGQCYLWNRIEWINSILLIKYYQDIIIDILMDYTAIPGSVGYTPSWTQLKFFNLKGIIPNLRWRKPKLLWEFKSSGQ